MIFEARLFNQYDLWIDLTYSLIVSISCFLIYLKTKELYDLSQYKGINYFRNTFLFFGISETIRLLLHLTAKFSAPLLPVRPELVFIFNACSFLMIYASCMALVYLLLSIFWKRMSNKSLGNVYLAHYISLIVAFVSLLKDRHPTFIIFQAGLFVLLIIVSYLNYKKSKHGESFSNIYLIYLLIFFLWIVSNVMEFIVIFSPITAFIIYFSSIIIFLLILIKVIERLK